MIYVDTSSLLKLIFIEDFSDEVVKAISSGEAAIVSGITRLEAGVQMRARQRGGQFGERGLAKAEAGLVQLLRSQPFAEALVSNALFDTALRQHEQSGIHCRSMDRLHLAAMEELGIRRLMTHDVRQAEAAREMEMEVVMPGVN